MPQSVSGTQGEASQLNSSSGDQRQTRSRINRRVDNSSNASSSNSNSAGPANAATEKRRIGAELEKARKHLRLLEAQYQEAYPEPPHVDETPSGSGAGVSSSENPQDAAAGASGMQTPNATQNSFHHV